jgi:catechol 2,3-dioxygenase-like lactoylglutathione lyase family enzyme
VPKSKAQAHAKKKPKPISKKAPKPQKTAPKKSSSKPGASLTFNHAMIYARDVERSLRFYRELLGFKLIEDFQFEGKPVYARLRAPAGEGTIALHQLGPGASTVADGVRLYFEVENLDDFCQRLQSKGVYFTKPPRVMPWGWRHAYLDDPDAHEISLYWAGENRMKKTMMKVAKAVSQLPKAKRPR